MITYLEQGVGTELDFVLRGLETCMRMLSVCICMYACMHMC